MERNKLLANVVAALLMAPAVLGQDAVEASSTGRGIRDLPNARFTTRDDLAQPVAEWTFEPIGYGRQEEEKRAIKVGPEGDATIAVPERGEGVLLRGAAVSARGDLVSAPFQLAPYMWVEVTVEYRIEAGAPSLFACLRPSADRALVDLEFLPAKRSAVTRRESVRLHSGGDVGPYALALGIGGIGTARILSVSAFEREPYLRPTKPLCVLDIRTAKPGSDPNPNFARVANVFGFPAVEYLHWTEYSPEKLKAIDPAVLVLPGLISLKGADERALDAAVKDAISACDAPVVGVCLGHQVLARVHGASLGRASEWGTTEIEIVRSDPVFAGLPDGGTFRASQSHNFAVREPVGAMQTIASSATCETQAFRYRGKKWYTFQGHIERGWEVAEPEGCVLWKNMLRQWGLITR